MLSFAQSSVYIVVGGASQYDYGDYVLTLDEEDCDSVPTNTNCSTAEAIDALPATFEADFDGISPSGNYLAVGACYLYSQWKTLWYSAYPNVLFSFAEWFRSHLYSFSQVSPRYLRRPAYGQHPVKDGVESLFLTAHATHSLVVQGITKKKIIIIRQKRGGPFPMSNTVRLLCV